MARVVVVGGGLGGAASAVRLAKLGHDVTLVEQRPHVGGAVGFVEHDGFRWDAGPAATALPAVLRDLFRKSGRPLEREADLVPVQPLRRHVFPDGTVLDLPSGSRGTQLRAVEEALGPGLGLAWVDYVHGHAETWDRLRRDWLERPYSEGLATDETRRLLRSRTSLAKDVSRRLPDRRLRAMALLPAYQLGLDPRRAPAWLGLLPYLEQNFGTWTLPGGMGTLAGLLAARLRQRRVAVLTSTTALDVAVGPHGPTGITTGSGPLPADRVVVAVDPRRLPCLARYQPHSRPVQPSRVTHLGLAGPVGSLPSEVVLHGAASPVTVRTGGTAPPGQAAWTVLSGPDEVADPLDRLAAAGLDVRAAVVARVERSSRDLAALGSPLGSWLKGPVTPGWRLSSRTPLPGVYAAGAATGGGGWLPFVGLTAAVVAQEIGPARS